MTKTNELQRAFILRIQPYRETSAIIELFTEQDGRVSAIGKGMRNAKKAKLQLFTDYWISLYGKGELKTLGQIEFAQCCQPGVGDALYAGFYINELMLYLIGKAEPMPKLWQAYRDALCAMKDQKKIESPLREFEFSLLQELGYGLTLTETVDGHPVNPESEYSFHFGHGLREVVSVSHDDRTFVFKGSELLAIANSAWQESHTLPAAKRLLRQVFHVLLDGRELKSRRLMQQLLQQAQT